MKNLNLVASIRRLRRGIIVLLYRNIEPYNTRRRLRELRKRRPPFQYGLMQIENNIKPLIKAFEKAHEELGNLAKNFKETK